MAVCNNQLSYVRSPMPIAYNRNTIINLICHIINKSKRKFII
ncbi:MAG: hypothetical protein ACMG55_18225 [Microcoleus sp.]